MTTTISHRVYVWLCSFPLLSQRIRHLIQLNRRVKPCHGWSFLHSFVVSVWSVLTVLHVQQLRHDQLNEKITLAASGYLHVRWNKFKGSSYKRFVGVTPNFTPFHDSLSACCWKVPVFDRATSILPIARKHMVNVSTYFLMRVWCTLLAFA